ncbi:hypothetical protein RCH33_2183 [Flavobacterium daejeonense]|nr:hypothetical protein RCH33_2183 [Flavobacterium daejeonense]
MIYKIRKTLLVCEDKLKGFSGLSLDLWDKKEDEMLFF